MGLVMWFENFWLDIYNIFVPVFGTFFAGSVLFLSLFFWCLRYSLYAEGASRPLSRYAPSDHPLSFLNLYMLSLSGTYPVRSRRLPISSCGRSRTLLLSFFSPYWTFYLSCHYLTGSNFFTFFFPTELISSSRRLFAGNHFLHYFLPTELFRTFIPSQILSFCRSSPLLSGYIPRLFPENPRKALKRRERCTAEHIW